MPFTRIELATFATSQGRLQVLPGRRAEAPQAGRWALPWGCSPVDLDAGLVVSPPLATGRLDRDHS
jgi:hypothetical protein